MLIIVCATTLEVGKVTREYFAEKDFEIVQKKAYEGEKTSTRAWYGTRNFVSKEEVLNCDFTYEVNGIITGFDKEQIIDAVRGRKDVLLSVSPDTFEFVKQVKATYGDYVRVVYVYIDETTLTDMTCSKIGMDEAECKARLDTGRAIRNFCANNMQFFDEIVIYGGENSAFDLEHLRLQYDNIIEKSIRVQEKLNKKMYVDLPYIGPEDYIFVSYSHLDTLQVIPILSQLQRLGYRIWYDEGIRSGANWRVFIGEKIENCKNFLLFSSKNSVDSDDVYAEINGILSIGTTPVITVQMDDSKFPLGIQMYLTRNQILDIKDKNFMEKLEDAMSPTTKN